jgi:hypothetical protein
MRTLLLIPLLLIISPAIQNPSNDSAVNVLSFKYFKSRQVPEQLDSGSGAPAAAMIPANKNFERNRRANTSPGERDPNLDTIDGRSAALDRSVQESRAAKPVDGFAYRVKVQNASPAVVEILFWEYLFIDATDPTIVSRRQFLCGVNIKPGKEKDVQAFSLAGPGDVVSAGTLAKKADGLFKENAVINRVEYSDGKIWQRKGWNLTDVKLGYERALRTPWGSEMCRGL